MVKEEGVVKEEEDDAGGSNIRMSERPQPTNGFYRDQGGSMCNPARQKQRRWYLYHDRPAYQHRPR